MPRIEFLRPDGSMCPGYYAQSGEERPSVIVLQEWWGLNPHICEVVDRFTVAGFNALAPDLYHGRVAQDVDEARHLMDGLDFMGAATQDIHGAAVYLQSQSSNAKVGIVGFCMGGALVITSAVHIPLLTAGVCFYGIPPKEVAAPADIHIPFQAHFANHDNWCTPGLVTQLEQEMTVAGNPPEVYRYDANHAFFNKMRPDVYKPAESLLAWDRTLSFFNKTLAE